MSPHGDIIKVARHADRTSGKSGRSGESRSRVVVSLILAPHLSTLFASEVAMNRFAAVVSSLLLCSGVAVCQYSASLDTSAGTSHLTMRFRAESFSGSTITGAPYSAEEVDENQQTLADGTHITQVMPTVKGYRDSMGRTRRERQPFHGAITAGSQHL